MDRSFADLNVGTQNITEPLQDVDRKVPSLAHCWRRNLAVKKHPIPSARLVVLSSSLGASDTGVWGKDDVESWYLAGDDVIGFVCHKLGWSAGKRKAGKDALLVRMRAVSQIAAERDHFSRWDRFENLLG